MRVSIDVDVPGLLVVDGSYGEGGGQILRTSVSLAALMGRPVEIQNIRAKRETPGLRAQHIAAIRAVGQLCAAEITGLQVGSSRVRFAPGPVSGPRLEMDVGTAGSVMLVLQAIIPVACFAPEPVSYRLVGGTDVRWSPTANYFSEVVLPAYRRLGLDISMRVLRRGYYPDGGGIVEGVVRPSALVQPIMLTAKRSAEVRSVSVVSRLPRTVADRQLSAAVNYLFNRGISVGARDTRVEDGFSSGTTILVYSVSADGTFIGADALGERGKPAEVVGKEAAQSFWREHCRGAPVDEHLGDMLVTLLAFAAGRSEFRVSRVTEHLRTNLHIAQVFTGMGYEIQDASDGTARVRVDGAAPH